MFLTRRFYILAAVVAFILATGALVPALFIVGKGLLLLLAVALAADLLSLYTVVGVKAERQCAQRFSLGDDNEVEVNISNRSRWPVHVVVVDELPVQLQKRDFQLQIALAPRASERLTYFLRPTERGQYDFGHLMVFVSTKLSLAQRRFVCGEPCAVKVYPSFLMLRRLELMAVSDSITEQGAKRVRRVGNNTDFEHIKDYVQGDDYRTINWKASARRNRLMVNVYQDERAQQVFSLIDKGRLMQQTFDAMTFLEYAINASLVLSFVAINRQDKAGVITFADQMGSFVSAERHSTQMQRIQECLYNQQTTFGESDYSVLCPNINHLVHRRSLMVLYTNFVDYGSLSRQLPYLRLLNQRHRLLVVFFEDAELAAFAASPQKDLEETYQHVIAEKLIYERRLIAQTLRQNGIYSLMTTPQQLSVDVINKYMEMKSRNLLT
jgi:uncharacterized protein (DUF58 family)